MVERITKHVPFAQIIYLFIIKSISTAEILSGNSHSIVRNINTANLLYFFIGLILWYFILQYAAFVIIVERIYIFVSVF